MPVELLYPLFYTLDDVLPILRPELMTPPLIFDELLARLWNPTLVSPVLMTLVLMKLFYNGLKWVYF